MERRPAGVRESSYHSLPFLDQRLIGRLLRQEIRDVVEFIAESLLDVQAINQLGGQLAHRSNVCFERSLPCVCQAVASAAEPVAGSWRPIATRDSRQPSIRFRI